MIRYRSISSAVLPLAAFAALSACSADPVIRPTAPIPPLYVDGFVDAERGVLIAVREPIPPDAAYDLDSLETAAPLGVEVRICATSGGDECAVVPAVSPGRWRLGELPGGVGPDVTLEIAYGDTAYRVAGRFPPVNALAYDSLETEFLPVERDVRDLYDDALEHDFAVAAASDSLALVIGWPEIDTDIAAGVFLTDGAEGCEVLDFRDSYQSLAPTCRLSEGVELSAYQFAEFADTVRFFLASTYDTDYPLFLEGLRQDNYNSGLGGLYDVLEVEGNLPGLGGYVLFSRSLEVVAVP